jgi:hypothetical protein
MENTDNIVQTWRTTLDQARDQWRAAIDSVLLPELEKRGVVVNSRSSSDAGDYVYFWFCQKGDTNFEICASIAMAFSVRVLQRMQASVWPSGNQSVYDLGNTTIKDLVTWLDTQPWIV